jgi:hypothetical protein
MTPAHKRRWFVIRCLVILVAIGVALYSLYVTVFFAWVATAPGSDANHAHAHIWANVWSTAFFISVATAVILLVWIIRDALRTRIQR